MSLDHLRSAWGLNMPKRKEMKREIMHPVERRGLY
jgi:hypothetical protein